MLSSPSFPIKTSSSVNSSISSESKSVTSGLSPSPFNVSSPGPPTKRSLPYPPLRTADVTPELLLFSESSSESQSGSGSGAGSESEMQISVLQQAGLSDGFPVQNGGPEPQHIMGGSLLFALLLVSQSSSSSSSELVLEVLLIPVSRISFLYEPVIVLAWPYPQIMLGSPVPTVSTPLRSTTVYH